MRGSKIEIVIKVKVCLFILVGVKIYLSFKIKFLKISIIQDMKNFRKV